MKKIKFLILLSLVFTLMTAWAQNSPASVKAKGTFNRDAEYACPENSLFSQLPSPLVTAWYGDDNYPFTRAGDDYTVTKPFTTMRFWGVNDGCIPGTSGTFIIKFYERNVSNPNIPGPEVSSFTLTATQQPISFFYGNDFQADVTFPSAITLLDGWVSLTRVNPGDGCDFAWWGAIGGNSVSYYEVENFWSPQGGQLAFCLGGGEKTPVSNWALILGIVLIGTFVFIRYRKIA
jgi:hypothetical protein